MDEGVRRLYGVIVKPNATKHTRVYGPNEPVDSIFVKDLLNEAYCEEILCNRLNNEFPIIPSAELGAHDRIVTNSCTTSDVSDPKRFRETGSELIGPSAELFHYLRHNDSDRYQEKKVQERGLSTTKIEYDPEGR